MGFALKAIRDYDAALQQLEMDIIKQSEEFYILTGKRIKQVEFLLQD